MPPWNAKKAFDKYIHDYMIKKNMLEAAETFAQEANIENRTIDVDSADGLLKKWWDSLWEVYTFINPPNAETKTITRIGEFLEILCSIFSDIPFGLPPSIQTRQSIDPFATSPKPAESSNQKTMNNAMETPAPMLPGPEMSQQALCGLPWSVSPESEESVTLKNPENPGFDGMPQMPTIFPKMHEQEEYLKRSRREIQRNTDQVRPDQNVGFGGMPDMPTILAKMYEHLKRTGRADLAAKILHFVVEKKSQMLSSSHFSPQVQEEVFQLEDVLEKIEQHHRILVEVQPQQQSRGVQHLLGRDGGRGANGETSKAVLVPGEGGATLVASEEVASKGSSVSSNGSSSSSC